MYVNLGKSFACRSFYTPLKTSGLGFFCTFLCFYLPVHNSSSQTRHVLNFCWKFSSSRGKHEMHSIDCEKMSPPFFIEKYERVLLPKIFDDGGILGSLFGGVGNVVYFS